MHDPHASRLTIVRVEGPRRFAIFPHHAPTSGQPEPMSAPRSASDLPEWDIDQRVPADWPVLRMTLRATLHVLLTVPLGFTAVHLRNIPSDDHTSAATNGEALAILEWPGSGGACGLGEALSITLGDEPQYPTMWMPPPATQGTVVQRSVRADKQVQYAACHYEVRCAGNAAMCTSAYAMVAGVGYPECLCYEWAR